MQNHEPSSLSGFRHILTREFMQRRQRNPSYSLRSFGRLLGVSPGALSEWLNGRRGLAQKTALKIADRLCLAPHERDLLVLSAAGLHNGLTANHKSESFHYLDQDQFQVMADWYHYAIINLVDVQGCDGSAQFFAERLGISKRDAAAAIKRLVKLDLLRIQNKRIVVTKKSLSSTHDVYSPALRRFHEQNLEKAKESLHRDEVETRNITSISMAIDPTMLPAVKEEIKLFRRKIASMLGDSKKKTRVYMLATQFFPLDLVKDNS